MSATDVARVDYRTALPAALEAMVSLETAVARAGVDPLLLELVRMRASQINGCAHCMDMHSKDALARGEDPQRLFVLEGWRETTFYSERERAALAWCEALTLVPQHGSSDAEYAAMEAHFSAEEIAAITYQIVAINGWNRLAVGFHAPVGDYVSPFAGHDHS